MSALFEQKAEQVKEAELITASMVILAGKGTDQLESSPAQKELQLASYSTLLERH